MSPNPHQTLEQVFGFGSFRDGQEAVIDRLLAGKSVLAIFPTGGGKSLCYQLPALLFDGLTLVISPLIALMKDQIDFLVGHGVAAARLDSSLNLDQTRQIFDDLHAGRIKLLYISPERLSNERFLRSLRRWHLSLLAIDEVHCVSEWGHNFRPDYMKIATLAKTLNVGRILGLTATATPTVSRDIATAFNIRGEDTVQTGFYRPNLNLIVTPSEKTQRKERLLQRLHERPKGPTIVYVTLQRTAEDVAAFLVAQNLDARPYHAGLKNEARHAIQDAFMASDRMIVVATIAFGMGVDKADIRAVYHYNLPKGMESYAQEIGRAGRDGQESVCELLASAEDAVVLENFTYGDTPTSEAIASFLDNIFGLGPVFDVSIHELSNTHDIRPLVVKTLLAYLELDRIIQSTGPFYTEFRFQPQKPSHEIVARFDAERAEFLRSLFQQAQPGRTWFLLDVDRAGRTLHQPRERIVTALDYLEQQGDLILKVGGVRQGYQLLEGAPADSKALEETLHARFQKREKQDIARVQTVLGFAAHDGCLTQSLLAYFGEQRDACGHCARCRGDQMGKLPTTRHRSLGKKEGETLEQLRSEGHASLATPRQLARFLCGLSSPATTRARLRQHPHFGAWSTAPFHRVLAFIEQRLHVVP